MSYSYRFGTHVVEFTQLQEETSAPIVIAARLVPAYGKALYGYGTTEAEAVVDLLRTRREQDTA